MAKRRRKKMRARRGLSGRVNWRVMQDIARPAVIISVVMLCGFAGWRSYERLMMPSTLPFRDVLVEGELNRVDARELRGQLLAGVNGGFFNLDLRRVQAGLEGLPWVYRASLRRVWPDRLEIFVEEERPIAFWNDREYLNQYGEVFVVPDASEPVYLPAITGSAGREKALIEAFVAADRMLHPMGLRVVELREDPRQDQRLILQGGVEVALGRKHRAERLERFALAYRDTLAQFIQQIAMLDLRYANGFSVRWRRDGMQMTKTSDGRV